MRILKQSSRTHPKLSLILLDWSVRESFHVLQYLKNQTVPRNDFEVCLIEFYSGRSEAALQFEPEIDTWILLEMPERCYYHKHLMYNAGILYSRGDILMFSDSDAMVRPVFLETVLRAFQRDPEIVYHMDQFRNVRRDFYPFNNPSFEDVLGDGCINNVGGKTKGILDDVDPMHTRNYGACMCASRNDIISIGGADEDLTYLGHVCGPYDMTFRLMNLGKRLVWETEEFLYHTWHPGSDGEANYFGPHDGRHMSTTAFQALCTGRVLPLVENGAIRQLRLGDKNHRTSELANLLIAGQRIEGFDRARFGAPVKRPGIRRHDPLPVYASYRGFDVLRTKTGALRAVPERIAQAGLESIAACADAIEGQSFTEIRDVLDSREGLFVETAGAANIYRVGAQFAVVPHELGAVDLRLRAHRDNPQVQWANGLDEARAKALFDHTAAQAGDGAAAAPEIDISLILPTRRRTTQLARLLESLRAMAQNPARLEVILVIDEDDDESAAFRFEGLRLIRVVLPPGSTMGQLNMAGYRKATGKYVMLVNDDIVVRTPGWDQEMLAAFRSCPDGIALVHVNDLVFRETLCIFPCLPRQFCDLMGGICPEGYLRYRIDDHIHNIFDLLSLLGHHRRLFLPDVIFEHTNVERDAAGAPYYVPDPAIHEIDTRLFDSLLEARRKIALLAIRHIDDRLHSEKDPTWRKRLDQVTDSVAIRRPEHARRMSRVTEQPPRVTIGVVSADVRSPHTKECLQRIKAHTGNYDLIVIDNSGDPGFNHSREMNRLLAICRTDYLVLMDDDVFVEPGWLEGLLRCLGPLVGVVTPLHKNRKGELAYAGIVMSPGDSGHHTHILEAPREPRRIQTLCSAIMAIDIPKCGHIRLDERYTKYFLDIEYGLRVWEEGFQVVCSPYSQVTHLAGATLEQGGARSAQLFEEQRRLFFDLWVQTGRYEALKRRIWAAIPEIAWILDQPASIERFIGGGRHFSRAEFISAGTALVRKLSPYPALRDHLKMAALAAIRGGSVRVDDPQCGHIVFLLGQAGLQPVLFDEGVNGMNIVLDGGRYYALPQGEGSYGQERFRRGDYSRCFEAGTPEEIYSLITDDRDASGGCPNDHAAFAGGPLLNPLLHFLQTPTRWPNPLFDPAYYTAANPDLAGANPLSHFIETGARQGRKPNPLFDTAYYLRQYPDAAASGLNPLQHFLEAGAARGYKPNPLFDTGYYLAENPDVAGSGINPLAHFLHIGARQGRKPNPLFDPQYYLRHNPDVRAAGLNPLAHFLERGAAEGRRPNPLFYPDFYLHVIPGLRERGLNPLAHFLEGGAADGCRPNPLFDPAYYLARYPDVAAAGINPLLHYLARGAAEGYRPNPLFDSAYYLERNPDVARLGLNPLEHFLEYGAQEGRRPNPLFDTRYYLAQYPDVAAEGVNALAHFLDSGAREGRRPNPLFHTSYYLQQNPDIAEAGVNPLGHFLESGTREGRRPNPLFHTSYYLRQNPDIADAGVNPLAHFLESGAREGRRPNPLFDPAYYLLRNFDVAQGGVNPLAHFLDFGAAEGRRPSPLFDIDQYRELHPELEPGVNPLAHFLDHSDAPRRPAPQHRNGHGGLRVSANTAPAPLSIVIPTFNRGSVLEATIEACLRNAGGCELEFVIVDDGSTDDTRPRLARLERTLPNLSWHSLGKIGPAQARNIGAASARHEIVLFLGDDIRPLTEDFFRVHGALHAQNPDVNLAVLGKVVWPAEEPVSYTMAHVQGRGAQQFGYSRLTPYSFVNWPDFYTANVSVKKALAGDWMSGGFHPDFPGAAFEDLEFAYRLSRNGYGLKIFYDPAAVAAHHHHYSLAAFMDRQLRSGAALAHFLGLHPEVSVDYDLTEIYDSLRAPRRAAEEHALHDYRLIIDGIKASAQALDAEGRFGTQPWHADFLSAVLDLCAVDGLLSAQPPHTGDLTAATALALDRFTRQMRPSLIHELADWGFLAQLLPQAAFSLLESRSDLR